MSSTFHGKNFSENWHSIKNTEDLTMKQMFDISEKLTSEQLDETIRWDIWRKTLHGSILSLIGDEQVVGLLHPKGFCIVSWTDEREPSIKYCMGRQIDVVQKVHQSTKLWTELMVNQWYSSGISSRDSPHCSPATKSKSYCQDWALHQRNFTGRIIFMSMFNDISWRSKDNKKECESTAQLVSLYAKRFGAGQSSFLGPGSEKKWYSISKGQFTRRMGQNCWADDVKIRRKHTPSLPIHESIV